jgi:hypothetical protein
VLFIGTQFSILYTSMYSPAEAATDVCADLVLLFAECGRSDSSTTGRGVFVFAMASASFALSPMGY